MKIYRAFAAAFVALFLLSACGDPVADARDSFERASFAAARVNAAKEYTRANKVNADIEKILDRTCNASIEALIDALKAAQAAATAPTKYAAKQRAADVRNAAATVKAAAKIAEATVLSVYPGYNADDSFTAYLKKLKKSNASNADEIGCVPAFD